MNYLQSPNAQQIQLNVPGNQIFSAGRWKRRVSRRSTTWWRTTRRGNLNTANAVADTTALGTALNWVSQQRVTIDNSITQLSSASTAVSSQEAQLTAAQTNLMQADVAHVSTQLAMAETAADGRWSR